MTYKELIKGAQIFAKYADKGLNGHIAGADHDVIWGDSAEVESTDAVDEYGEQILIDLRMTAEDNRKLKELGWFIDPQNDAWTGFC